jgi:TolB protein
VVPGEQVELATLDIVCAGNHPQINAQLAGVYGAWRAEVLATTGYDVLGQISDMFRPLGYSRSEYGHLSWHRTGRAVDLLFEWRAPADDENRLLVVREDLGPQTYWRLYIRAREQDGTMGEPLTDAPWVFWFELDPDKEASAYAAGGRLGPIPLGFYVDLTRLARRHGWHRIASYQEANFDWRTDSVGREFWHYQRTDGLTWWEAMLEIYPLETVEQYYGWSVCIDELDLDPAWLTAKGIPTPSP